MHKTRSPSACPRKFHDNEQHGVYELSAHGAYRGDFSPSDFVFDRGSCAFEGFSEYAYREAKEPKELYVVPDAIHIDLYDDTSKIPFDKIETFLREALDA